ncbi:MAG: ribonuclease [Erysipelotrichaceae bacterium]|nr:ribonuclease [Erysipelotrichaceae bacterium]
MKKLLKILFISLLITIGVYAFISFTSQNEYEPVVNPEPIASKIDEQGSYTSKEDVSLYIITYGHLPNNFVTKKKAREMGWKSNKGNLQKVCKGCSIGGDIFTNSQKVLPVKKGRVYYECDINYDGGYRGKERLIFSNDGLIYYTDDHYSSFELLYGEE